ncbi:hypothetical protein [Mycobacteroides abscessus]|uniref:hypothetical protein n=1 Tax=Mycobacteroides abscessus TaxID=36809 RepID=UPI0009A8EB0F|nr:hypothetical protein [Mycobacteroides abscessus]
MVMKDRWTMSARLRRASALAAIVALAVGGAKVVDGHTLPGSGFSAVATVAADPTGPPGPTGGMTDGGGSQFQPPQMPSSMPDYQGGNNRPPLDQNSGISIYNTGSPGAQQVPGQQAGQQPQQAQQPAHGSQIPDYQTNPGYTQGPGKPNPDYQAPQQNAPQQPQQGQQPQQQQPSQQQPQNKQDDTTQQLNQKQQQCQAAMAELGNVVPPIGGGGGRSPIWWFEPGLDPVPTPGGDCPGGCPSVVQKPDGSTVIQMTPEQYQKALEDAAKKGGEEAAKKMLEEEQKKNAFSQSEMWGKAAKGCVTAGGITLLAAWYTGPVDWVAAGIACVGGAVTGVADYAIDWANKGAVVPAK